MRKSWFFVRFWKSTALFFGFAVLLNCGGEKAKPAEAQWINLFNGQDFSGWKIKISGHDLGDNVRNTFHVEDGLLKVSYDEYEQFDGKFGHIFYDKKFSHYRIRVEYRFTGEQVAGGPGWAFRNNGIMLHCQSPENMEKDQDFPVSIEAQMLGGNGTDERSTGNLCTPGTNVVINDSLITNHCINANSKTYHSDQWVTMEVVVRGNEWITHIVNGDTVLAYEKPQLDERDPQAVAIMQQGGSKMLSEGYIALQAESHPIEFRKIELQLISSEQEL